MINETFEKYRKDLLADNSFLFTPIREKYEMLSDEKKQQLQDMNFKESLVSDYILIMYTLSTHPDEVDPEIVALIESWIEKRVDFDWSTIDDNDVLQLFNDKSKDFCEEYLDKVTISSYRSDKYLEMDTLNPCRDSIVCISNRSLFDISLYLKRILSGAKDRVIIMGIDDDRWKNITEKYDAIKIGCVSDNVEEVVSDIKSALSLLEPNGYVILERDVIFADRTLWGNLESELIKEKLLQAYFYDGFSVLLYLQSTEEYKGIHMMLKKIGDARVAFEDKYFRRFVDINIIKAMDYDLSSLVEHPDVELKAGEKAVCLKEFLLPVTQIVKDSGTGRVFKYKNMSTGYNDWLCAPENLDIENLSGNFVKATWPVCVLNKDLRKPIMTYIPAAEMSPVYIGEQFLVYRLDEHVMRPEYFFLLVFNGQFGQTISGRLEEIESYQGGEYWVSETECVYVEDPGLTMKLCNSRVWLNIPVDLEAQDRAVMDAKLVWKVMADREDAQKVLFNELEWLNEEHIRNIKHKTRGDLDCIKGDLSTLMKAFKNSRGQLCLSDKFSPASDRSVEQAIESMLRGLTTVVDTVAELTDVAKNRTEINLYEFFRKYADQSHYANQCNICIFNMAKDLNILVDSKNLQEILDLFIENALRHGKKNDPNAKLIIRISCEDCYNGRCLITLENNGKPMTPRAKDIYFVRDSYAGETANTGQGGADIKKLVTSNHGSVELHAVDDAEYPVGLWMYFDIVNK